MGQPQLENRVALVAGGTRGAGRGIATELGAAGATVYVTGRTTRARRSPMNRPETIGDTAELVSAAGGHGIALPVDHSDPDQVDGLLARIERDHGGQLDILVNELHGRRIAAIAHDPSLADEPQLVRAAGAAAALALENQRLSAELRANIEELRASRARLVEAGDSERRRLERDLHDGAQSRLVALAVKLRLARMKSSDQPEVEAILDESSAELQASLDERVSSPAASIRPP